MSVIPCEQNKNLKKLIEEYADFLKEHAHEFGRHGLTEHDFHNSGLFRGAIERISGQFSATMREKRDFAARVFNIMQDAGIISGWRSAGEANRHDYTLTMNSGKICVIELKGCLDGNNTNIFERPAHAEEFIIWSVCTNTGANPRLNAWYGIHTRLSAEIISRSQRVDGLVIWDMVCGTFGRKCPKSSAAGGFRNVIGQYRLPPPCIYVFPATIASPRNNPSPHPQRLEDVQILNAFVDCFGGSSDEVNFVEFSVRQEQQELVRRTRITRGGTVVHESRPTPIQRS